MKRNEAWGLCRGNYVRLKKDDSIVRVGTVTRNKIGYHLTKNEHNMHYVRICEIEDIPLTREILIDNDFATDFNGYRYDLWSNRDYRHLSLRWNPLDLTFYGMDAPFTIQNIRALQNVMITFGFVDEAMNIKLNSINDNGKENVDA